MKPKIPKKWQPFLKDAILKDRFKSLVDFLSLEYQKSTVFPIPEKIFAALELTSFDEVSVIILGQDPYHNPGQADGLAFSVPKGVPVPPSLKNIYKEINRSLLISKDMKDGDLGFWAQQGVLLLNTILTVEENRPGSHRKIGWEDFTNHIISQVSEKKEHCVFLLWGKYAEAKSELIDHTKHLVLTSPHPSPFSAHRGFFGNNHFVQANEYLKKHKKKPIEW